MEMHTALNLQTCPVCGVSIANDGTVLFTNGNPGTRARLQVRVCQFARKPGCINQNSDLIGQPDPKDHYDTGKDLVIPDFPHLM